GNASDEPQQLAHDGSARHGEGQLDHGLAEPGDLARRGRYTAGKATPVEVELCGNTAIRDRHVVRVLDPNPSQESHLQALPGNRFETGEAHPQWFMQTDPGACGQRRDHEYQEGGTADHGSAPPPGAAARVVADTTDGSAKDRQSIGDRVDSAPSLDGDRDVAWLRHGLVSSLGSHRFYVGARV